MSTLRALPLPQPGQKLLAHSEQLRGVIAARIQATGPMPFHDYMELALYHPELGYYSAGLPKFGPAGDYITAPELGPVFACCLARSMAATLQDCAPAQILEIGAGSGALAVDLLLELERLDTPPAGYWILERSADCRARQRETLQQRAAHWLPYVLWLDTPPKDPFDGVIIGNEVVDALAVHGFEMAADRVRERMVGLDDAGQFRWDQRPADARLRIAVRCLEAQIGHPLPPGYCSEINLHLEPWLSSIATSLRRGLVLLSDYGYPRAAFYQPSHARGTLICHFQHRVHDDPFVFPGLQDITAFVDFSALAEAGCASGLDLLAYGPQAGFLLANGLDDIGQRIVELGPLEAMRLSQEIKTLTLPEEMGERFQIMAFGRGKVDAVAMLSDWTHQL